MCLPIGSMLLRSKILWMKHVVFWREPDGVIPRATGDWLTGRWDSRKVLRHCHNTWKTSTYARRCWSSRFWHSDWKSGLFPDFYRKYSKVRTFPGPGGQQLKIRTFPGNKDPWEPCINYKSFLKQILVCCCSSNAHPVKNFPRVTVTWGKHNIEEIAIHSKQRWQTWGCVIKSTLRMTQLTDACMSLGCSGLIYTSYKE